MLDDPLAILIEPLFCDEPSPDAMFTAPLSAVFEDPL